MADMPRQFESAEFSRKNILLRFLMSIVCVMAFEIVRLLVQAITFFQFLYLLVMRQMSEPLRQFSARLAEYGHGLMRYSMLCDNDRPFPFGPLPPESKCERPVRPVRFP